MAALAFRAGVGSRFLASRFPDDRAIWRAIANRAADQREEERQDLARRIANMVGKMLDGKTE